MRITSAAICILFIAGCGGGGSDVAAPMAEIAVASHLGEVETKSLDKGLNSRLVREAFDNAMVLVDKARSRSDFDKAGDELLSL